MRHENGWILDYFNEKGSRNMPIAAILAAVGPYAPQILSLIMNTVNNISEMKDKNMSDAEIKRYLEILEGKVKKWDEL